MKVVSESEGLVSSPACQNCQHQQAATQNPMSVWFIDRVQASVDGLCFLAAGKNSSQVAPSMQTGTSRKVKQGTCLPAVGIAVQ